MDSKQWQKVKELFSATLDLPANERGAFLANVEAEVRGEVEKLLSNFEDAEEFINEPAVVGLGLGNHRANGSRIRTKIDDYLILEEIGAGGMGAVYLAEQQSDNLSHRVALKLIKRGMDTTAVLKRFVMERQILANLEHPYIARFLDGGTTADGVPYFVMEYVEGLAIKKYCDAHALDTAARVELFRKVCAAASFAHQNLIVHRDLKPSNILVTEAGEPKLLDFGIAKLLNPDWSPDTAEATATMFRVMTPAYASPEQLRGLPVTTASDVYSLGVVLYELLTGARPFKIDSRAPDEIAQIVLSEDPVKPSDISNFKFQISDPKAKNETDRNDAQSTSFSVIKTNPKSQIRNPKLLRGDLDNIILKALRKEPERRYQTVQEFSEDLRRHLAGLPVSATADTLAYRVSKFVRRHRAGVFAAALIALTLVVATVATTWQARRANLERDKAEQRFRQVRKLANLVVFEYHDGIEKLAGSTVIREKMVRDALEYLDNLSTESVADSDLQKELAAAYLKIGDVQGNPYLANLGDQNGAFASYQKALAIRRKLFSQMPGDVQTRLDLAVSHEKLGDILWAKGEHSDSAENYRKALEICENLASETSLPASENYAFVRLNNRLGQVFEKRGNLFAALESYQKSFGYAAKLAQAEPSNAKYRRGFAVSHLKIGDVLHLLGKYAEAYENFQKSTSIFEELAADPSNAAAQRDLTLVLARLAAAETELGEYEKSLENNRRTIQIQEQLAAADPNNLQIKFDIADTYTNFGETLGRLKRYPEAEKHLRRAIGIFSASVAKNSEYPHARSHFANTYQKYAEVLLKKGAAENALENYRRALALFEDESVKIEAPDRLAETYEGIGDALAALNRQPAEIKEMYQKSLEVWKNLKETNNLSGKHAGKPEEVLQKIVKLDS